MSTKSISKNISIKSNSAGLRLANAIEKSEKSHHSAPTKPQKRVNLVTDLETIKKLFGD